MELEKLQRDRVVDAAYQALRNAILSSAVLPGERLNVDDLARKLGVSLTPVRQAIQQLATEGLVEIRPRSGTFVAKLTAQDVDETFEIRYALEALAAERAIDKMSPQDLRTLRDLLKTLRKPVRTDEDRKEHEEANSALHLTLIRTAGNNRLAEMYEDLNAHLKIARIHRTEEGWPARLREEQAEHEAIVDALESRDLVQMQAALRKHIYRAKSALIAGMSDR